MAGDKQRTQLRPGLPARGTASGRPLMVALDLFGRRGALRVLWELRDAQPRSFRALADAAELPPATLNVRLRELRDLCLVELDGGYRLTRLGLDLADALEPLTDWAARWAGRVAASNEVFTAPPGADRNAANIEDEHPNGSPGQARET